MSRNDPVARINSCRLADLNILRLRFRNTKYRFEPARLDNLCERRSRGDPLAGLECEILRR